MKRAASDARLLKPEEIDTWNRGGGASTTLRVTRGMGASAFITGYTGFQGQR